MDHFFLGETTRQQQKKTCKAKSFALKRMQILNTVVTI
jgi:hypothetical protein